MKKSLLLLLPILALSFELEVKKADVELLINGTKQGLKKGKKATLNAGDRVCFISGDGRVVIKGKDYSKQLSKHSTTCKVLPGKIDTKSKPITDTAKEAIVAILGTAQEQSVSGVSRKSASSEKTITTPIKINKQEFIIIQNSKWGPLPITLTILDNSGKTIKKLENKDDTVSSFLIKTKELKSGYKIKATNAFGEVLMDSKVN